MLHDADGHDYNEDDDNENDLTDDEEQQRRVKVIILDDIIVCADNDCVIETGEICTPRQHLAGMEFSGELYI